MEFRKTPANGWCVIVNGVEVPIKVVQLLLHYFPNDRIPPIKIIREMTGFGLVESKNVVDFVIEANEAFGRWCRPTDFYIN